jgi:monofunctional biosynthetic peptidoglycan transglycosylase
MPPRLLFALVAVAFVVVLLPYVIAPFYRFVNPVSTVMAWRWLRGERVERTFVPLNAMSPSLPLTVIVAEDGTFCRNPGVDLAAMREALTHSDDLADARGASTITQQTAKNLFLWQGRSFVRKALELPLALWLNLVLPKRRVLEIYLNIAEWGPNGEFGVEAASRWAFGHSAREVTPYQAAALAAILPNPIERSARTPSPLVRRLAGLYTRRAEELDTRDICVQARPGRNPG